ncbi:MAG: 2-dehydro-3-deoxyglucarate aldolase [Candidatus Dormibacteraeota bacterium]|nr:2-dehydro-3-deoxyglucarate aldolase [Candidatus Dormibacteraeota bacterium]
MNSWLGRKDGPRIAAVVTLADPCVTEMMGAADVDLLIVDMEHAPISERELEGMLIAAASVRKPVLVRVVENNPTPIKRVIDTGVDGIIVPNVSSPAAARAAVASVRYPPLGVRGYGPRRAGAYGQEGLDYTRRSDTDLLLVVQIEDIGAVRVASEIVAVPGVGGVMLGPNDLSASMGVLGQIEHPDVLRAVESVIAVCQAAGVPVGCGGYFGDVAHRLIRLGIDFVTAGGDIWFMRQELEHSITTLRQVQHQAV